MNTSNYTAAGARAGDYGPDAQKRQKQIDKLAMAELEAGRALSLTDAEALVTARVDAKARAIPRVFRRLFVREQSAAEQIARLQRQIADERAEAVRLKREHEALIIRVAQLKAALSGARGTLAALSEKADERRARIGYRLADNRGDVVDLTRFSAELLSFERAIAEVSAFIENTERAITEVLAQLAMFEKEHADDLVLVEESAA